MLSKELDNFLMIVIFLVIATLRSAYETHETINLPAETIGLHIGSAIGSFIAHLIFGGLIAVIVKGKSKSLTWSKVLLFTLMAFVIHILLNIFLSIPHI